MKKIHMQNLEQELKHIYTNNSSDIKLHPNEVVRVLNYRDHLYMSKFKIRDENAVIKTTTLVLNDMSKQFDSLKNIHNILMHFSVNDTIKTSTIIDAMYVYKSHIAKNANIYLGVSYDKYLPKNYVKTTVLI